MVTDFALTYYVCTEGAEGMRPTHVEVGRVEPLEEADVIETLRLEEVEKAREDVMVKKRVSVHRREPTMKRNRMPTSLSFPLSRHWCFCSGEASHSI